jgi:hypothetical protein
MRLIAAGWVMKPITFMRSEQLGQTSGSIS